MIHTDLVKPEQLLIEIEDLLKSAPSLDELHKGTDESLPWLGRAAAVIKQWNAAEYISFSSYQREIFSGAPIRYWAGYREIMILLRQAQHDLRLRTVGPLNVVINKGQVFAYFDELKGIVEQATNDVLFVDAYLNADLVSRYLPFVRDGVSIRLLTDNDAKRLSQLLPAVDLFVTQSKQRVNVRTTAGLHDRYLLVDNAKCYASGASFKDGAKNASTTIVQIIDIFVPVRDSYEALWNNAKVER